MFSSKETIRYTYSQNLNKHSTSNASLLQQLKKSDKVVKIRHKFCSLRTLQTTERDRNIVINRSR